MVPDVTDLRTNPRTEAARQTIARILRHAQDSLRSVFSRRLLPRTPSSATLSGGAFPHSCPRRRASRARARFELLEHVARRAMRHGLERRASLIRTFAILCRLAVRENRGSRGRRTRRILISRCAADEDSRPGGVSRERRAVSRERRGVSPRRGGAYPLRGGVYREWVGVCRERVGVYQCGSRSPKGGPANFLGRGTTISIYRYASRCLDGWPERLLHSAKVWARPIRPARRVHQRDRDGEQLDRSRVQWRGLRRRDVAARRADDGDLTDGDVAAERDGRFHAVTRSTFIRVHRRFHLFARDV